MAEKVGIRELRQNLSVYVRRVRKGERFIVTDHNEPVAELVPVAVADETAREAEWRRLVDKFGMREATGSIEDLQPMPYPDGYDGPTATELLLRERDSYYEDDDRG